MNIEDVRQYALSLNERVTEDLFAEEWISWRIEGKWFLLMQLDAPTPRVAVKLPPEVATELREQFEGVTPAYHMNKTHWSDLYLEQLNDDFVKEQIQASYRLVVSKLPKKIRETL
jgi:predicted DNA-binding protein (MmcQ/YjbR family)